MQNTITNGTTNDSTRRMIIAAAAGALGLATAGTALAGGDVWVGAEGGAITVLGSIDHDNPADQDPGVTIFESFFGETPGSPDFSDEPGFYTLSVAPGTEIGLEIVSPLREFTGSGFGPTAQTLEIFAAFGVPSAPSISSPGDQMPFIQSEVPPQDLVDGFGATGFFDDHPDYRIGDLNQTGIFLTEMRLYDPTGVLAPSDSFFILFGNGVTEDELEAAEPFVPTPGALGVLALGGMAALRRRRA